MEDDERAQKRIEKLDTDIALNKQRVLMLQSDLEQQKVITRRLEAEAEAEVLKTDSLKLELETRKRAYDEMRATNRYHHIYRFDDDVNEATVDHCMERLNMWHRTEPGCDMEIIFNSQGGNVIYGMELFDYIMELRNNNHKITTGTRGIAASMASILLQAGEERWMGRHATLMVHQPSSVIVGKTDDMHDQLEWIQGLQEQALDIYAERCKNAGTNGTASDPQSREEIAKNWKRKDYYLDSTKAVKYGFVDSIRG